MNYANHFQQSPIVMRVRESTPHAAAVRESCQVFVFCFRVIRSRPLRSCRGRNVTEQHQVLASAIDERRREKTCSERI